MREIELPAGYRREELENGVELIALPEAWDGLRHAVDQSGTLFDYASTRPGAFELAGRGVAWHIAAPGSYTNERWVVRHYRRRGVFARLLHDRYLDSGTRRPLREIITTAKARERGVATPEVVAAAVYPVGGWYRADIAARYLPGASLAERIAAETDDALVCALMRMAGALFRSAHDAGLVHDQPTPEHILIAADQGMERAWLVGMDRAIVMRDELSRFERDQMLRTFARSLRAIERRMGRRFPDAARHAFAAAYGPDNAVVTR